MTWFLYIILIVTDHNGTTQLQRVPMPDKATCFEALSKVKIGVSQGNESESGFAAFCGTHDYEKHYNTTWWRSSKYIVK